MKSERPVLAADFKELSGKEKSLFMEGGQKKERDRI